MGSVEYKLDWVSSRDLVASFAGKAVLESNKSNDRQLRVANDIEEFYGCLGNFECGFEQFGCLLELPGIRTALDNDQSFIHCRIADIYNPIHRQVDRILKNHQREYYVQNDLYQANMANLARQLVLAKNEIARINRAEISICIKRASDIYWLLGIKTVNKR